MKKLFVLLLALALVFAFAACGAAPADDATEPEEAAEETTEDTTEDTTEETSGEMLEVVNSGWSLPGDYLYYWVELRNNSDKDILFPSFDINARNAEGTLIGTQDQVLNIIHAGETEYYASQAFSLNEEPATVEIVAKKPADYNIVKPTDYTPFTVISATDSGDNLVGEISNENDEDFSMAAVVVLYKDADSNYIGGETTYTDGLPAHGTAPFSVYQYTGLETDSFDVFAYPW